jgi:hypothetical protein
LQGDEASPKPSTSTNAAAPVNFPTCGTSEEHLHYHHPTLPRQSTRFANHTPSTASSCK